MYRVFLSHNTANDEMVVVWRLQTLASASGLHLDVPNPTQRSDWPTVAGMIDAADVVVAFLTRAASPEVNTELEYALSKGKRIIPIVENSVVVDTFLRNLNSPVFIIDPDRPWEMEQKLASFLSNEKVSKESQSALLALAGTFVGLLLLQGLSKDA